jgi:hypothetical protein
MWLCRRAGFAPRHDQRLRTSLEKRVDGLSALHILVESAERLSSNEISPEEHVATVRGIFKRGGG